MRAAAFTDWNEHDPSRRPREAAPSMSGVGGHIVSRREAELDSRLMGRNEQTRSWAAPLPDLTVMPRVGPAPRVRVEWDTRDSLNHRLWADTMATGAKAVTSTMLLAHPTAGAETMMPAAGRQDYRHYHESGRPETGGHVGAPQHPARGGLETGLPGMLERPGIPKAAAWFDTSAMDTHNAIRDVRGVVRENNGGRGDDVAARLEQRTFQNQWMTPNTLQTIVEARLGAAAALRPQSDDWRAGVPR